MLEGKIELVSALFFIGIAAIVISVIMGFLTGTFFGFIIALLSGIVSGMIFFALSHILNNQQSILYKLDQLEEIHKKQQEKKICSNCNYEYDINLSSCPYCGRKD
ncbi:hypothetical protein K0H71_16475 [Bacillus sp. IITD106]|nr:hypothetical protein [Bacillus sp. IITD106]